MFKNLMNMAGMLRQAQQMGGKMQELQNALRSERVKGAAGAGLVEVEANGIGELIRISIDKDLIDRHEHETIEQLTVAAVNQALAAAKQKHMEMMQSLAAGVDLPGLSEALANLGGKD